MPAFHLNARPSASPNSDGVLQDAKACYVTYGCSSDECTGMHGAALAWSLLMPPGTALLELWPEPGMWRLYEHTAQWAGLLYRSAHCTLLHVTHLPFPLDNQSTIRLEIVSQCAMQSVLVCVGVVDCGSAKH